MDEALLRIKVEEDAAPRSLALTSAEVKQLKGEYGLDEATIKALLKGAAPAIPAGRQATPFQPSAPNAMMAAMGTASAPYGMNAAAMANLSQGSVIDLQQEWFDFENEMEKLTAALNPKVVRERTEQELELAKARAQVSKAMTVEMGLRKEFVAFDLEMHKLQEALDPSVVRERAKMELRLADAQKKVNDAMKADKELLEPKSVLDSLVGFMKGIRGTAGGLLGTVVGAGLDIASATGAGEKKGAEGGGVGALGAAGPVGMAIAGVFLFDRALKSLTATVTNTISAVGSFAAKMISPDANPATFIAAVGDTFTQIGNTLSGTIPIIGTLLGGFASALGAAVNAVAGFMRALDGMVDRYAAYSPALAQAQAMADVTQMLADFRRAQQVTPELVQYLRTRTELQQKFEDAKIKFLIRMMPTAIKIMGLTEKLVPFVEAIVNILSGIAEFLGAIMGNVSDIANDLDKPDIPEGFDFNLNGFPWQLAQALGQVRSPQAQ